MGFLKAAVGGVFVFSVGYVVADNFATKLPESIKAGSTDLRPYVAGGLAVAALGLAMHAIAR